MQLWILLLSLWGLTGHRLQVHRSQHLHHRRFPIACHLVHEASHHLHHCTSGTLRRATVRFPHSMNSHMAKRKFGQRSARARMWRGTTRERVRRGTPTEVAARFAVRRRGTPTRIGRGTRARSSHEVGFWKLCFILKVRSCSYHMHTLLVFAGAHFEVSV